MTEKRGILAVSFGTTHEAAERDAIGAVERSLERAFPEYAVRRAYTSTIVRRRLERRGVRVPGVGEALRGFAADGYTHVWVQPTHLIPGEEYDRLTAEAERCRDAFAFLKIGEPLLACEEDYDRAVAIMKRQTPVADDEACVFMGHGTYHAAKRAYERIERRLAAEPDRRYFMATVEEGLPLTDVCRQLEQRGGIHRIVLTPFMLVAGEHATQDMAGEDAASWKSVLEARGYQVSCKIKGMGSYEEIRELYVRKCRKCLGGVFYGISVGPGAGGDLTLNAAERIRRCGVLAVPRTGGAHTAAFSAVRRAQEKIGGLFSEEDFFGLSEKELVYLDFSMTEDEGRREEIYREMTRRLCGYLAEGKDVGMIALGDVGVYSTASRLASGIASSGYEVRLLPGVTSFCACAAALGESLTSGNRPLHILPAGCGDIEESLRLSGTKVVMKSGKRLPELMALLRRLGLYESSSMVKDCGMETQEQYGSLDDDTGRESYFTTVLTRERTRE